MNILTTQHTTPGIQSEIRDGLALLDLARGWLQQGNPVVALELLKGARDSADAERDVSLRARILKETGRAQMMQSAWDLAEAHYIEAERLFVQLDDMTGAAECSRNRANMMFQQGNYIKAEMFCEQALEWASTTSNYELRATVLNTLAAVKSATGNNHEALKTFKLCLADFQAARNAVRQGYVLLNIGLTQIELGDFAEAIQSLNEALAISMKEKDLQLVEICYQNISKCYLEQKEVILAKSVIDTAKKVLPGLNSRALETEHSLMNGRILRAMGDFENARICLNQTYEDASTHQLSALQADVLYEQGLLHKDLGELSLASGKLQAAAGQYRQLRMDKGFQAAIQAVELINQQMNLR